MTTITVHYNPPPVSEESKKLTSSITDDPHTSIRNLERKGVLEVWTWKTKTGKDAIAYLKKGTTNG